MKAIIKLLTFLALCLPLALNAQTFPAKPITLVVPHAPGGPVDLVPRLIAAKLSKSMGVPVIVENRPGAGGNIGAAYVAKANPDGYTLMAFAGVVLTTNPWLFRDAPFSADKDFVPIVNFASTPNVLVVPPSLNVASVKELIEMIKARPGTFNYGTPGPGTSPHLCVEMMKQTVGNIALEHIPYKGGAEVVKDLLEARIQMACSNIAPVITHIQAGRLRALAVSGRVRHPLLPNVPTMEEAGLPGFLELLGWFGLAAPAGTPRAVINALNAEVNLALRDPQIVERLAGLGLTPVGGTPEELAKYIAAESARWRVLIEQAKIKID